MRISNEELIINRFELLSRLNWKDLIVSLLITNYYLINSKGIAL